MSGATTQFGVVYGLERVLEEARPLLDSLTAQELADLNALVIDFSLAIVLAQNREASERPPP